MDKVCCSLCGMNFVNSNFLAQHIRDNHLGQFRYLDWTTMKDPHRYFTKCLNCRKQLPIKVPYYFLEAIDCNPNRPDENEIGYKVSPPPMLFCSKSCKIEYYRRQQEESNRFGNPLSATYYEGYEDQGDWNR